MFRKSLEDFINTQRIKLAEERVKLGVLPYHKKENRRNHGDDRDEHPFYADHAKASDDDDQNMLNIGEFSPNNPKMRVTTHPYLGQGEYDHRRQLLNDQRKAEYQQYTEQVKRADEQHTAFMKSNYRPVNHTRSGSVSADKAVQTDIKNVQSKLVHYEMPEEKQQKPSPSAVAVDMVDNIEPQSGYTKYMDRVGAIANTSPRDLQSQCFPSKMGYLPQNTVDDARFEKVRKQEKYLAELRQQVEEKQMLQRKHKEDERHEDDLECARVETQMRNLNFNKQEGFGHGRHCYSTDYAGSINRNAYGHEHEREHDATYTRNKRMNETRLNSSKYPERDIYKPPYSFNIAPNSVFANSVPVTKKHSKLILNTNNNSNSSSKGTKLKVAYNKLDESLPIPVLKAQSPVAKELANALPVQSRTSEAMRKLEDKWQIPAVQKNFIKASYDQGILTQLGAIRLQLQQEQLRLDETLRKRGTSRSQQTNYADIRRTINY